MRTARAFLWEYRRRHQLALAVLAAYLLIFLVLQLTVIGDAYRIKLNPPNGFAFFAILPGTATLFYLIGAFTYGMSGDLAARESIYPRRLMTLPVTTHALVGWPMLFGGLTAAALWVVMALFMRLAGADYQLPLLWPATLCAVYVAWMQALTWMPYGIPGVRVIAAVLWLVIVDATVIAAFQLEMPERVMLSILVPQLPVAYLVAHAAVARARRGVVPDWTRAWTAPLGLARSAFRRRGAFRSASGAQLWFEWRRSGRALPGMVFIVVPAELAILFIPSNNTRTPGLIVPMFVLLTPPLLAFFSATMMGTPTAFTATRPLDDAALVAAKLKATLLSTLVAWLFVLIAIPLALIWSGASVPVMDAVRSTAEVMTYQREITLMVFVVLALMLSTWRQLVQNLCITLTGNALLIKSTVLAGLVAMMFLGPGLQWFFRHQPAQEAVWEGLPLIAMAVVSLKFIVAAVVVSKVHAQQALSDRVLLGWAVAWLAAVAAVYGVITWWSASQLTPAYLKATIAILLVPLGRVLAAPLALAWSRHR